MRSTIDYSLSQIYRVWHARIAMRRNLIRKRLTCYRSDRERVFSYGHRSTFSFSQASISLPSLSISASSLISLSISLPSRQSLNECIRFSSFMVFYCVISHRENATCSVKCRKPYISVYPFHRFHYIHTLQLRQIHCAWFQLVDSEPEHQPMNLIRVSL
jgi:hypothetical protein